MFFDPCWSSAGFNLFHCSKTVHCTLVSNSALFRYNCPHLQGSVPFPFSPDGLSPLDNSVSVGRASISALPHFWIWRHSSPVRVCSASDKVCITSAFLALTLPHIGGGLVSLRLCLLTTVVHFSPSMFIMGTTSFPWVYKDKVPALSNASPLLIKGADCWNYLIASYGLILVCTVHVYVYVCM